MAMSAAWIAPSILSADFARLGEEVEAVLAAGADLIHFDVMDNHYVPNLTIGPMVCEALRKRVRAPIDVHLMVSPVDRIVPDFAAAGASYISFHPEATQHVDRTIHADPRARLQPGLVFNPATPLDWLDYTLEKLDLVLMMSVNPGFGGQQFIPTMLRKIADVRRRIDATGREVRLEVDGGIKIDNIGAASARGCRYLRRGLGDLRQQRLRAHHPADARADRGRVGWQRSCGRRAGGAWPALKVKLLVVVLVIVVIVVVRVDLPGGAPSGGGLRRHDHRTGLHLRSRVEDHDGLAGGAQQALLLEHLEHAAGHFARAADQARELLAAHLDLHAFRVSHGVGLVAQVHDRVRDAPGDIDEGEVAELAVGAIQACGELRGQLEHQPRALGGDLPEARVGHFRQLAG